VEVVVWIHTFLTSTLGAGEWSASISSTFIDWGEGGGRMQLDLGF